MHLEKVGFQMRLKKAPSPGYKRVRREYQTTKRTYSTSQSFRYEAQGRHRTYYTRVNFIFSLELNQKDLFSNSTDTLMLNISGIASVDYIKFPP